MPSASSVTACLLLAGMLVQVGAGCSSTQVDTSVNAVLDIVVRRNSETPAVGASFTVSVVDTVRGYTVIEESMGVTDGGGRFRSVVGAFLHPPFVGRVAITVRPPALSGLGDSTVDGGVVAFKDRTSALETLHVSIVYGHP